MSSTKTVFIMNKDPQVDVNKQNIETNTTTLSNLQSLSSLSTQTYTTENLPSNVSNGTIAFDSTISKPVYFVDGRWLKLSDDSLVVEKVIEVYVLSGQSNAGGTASSANL